MNLRIIAKVTSVLILILDAFLLVCAGVAAYYLEWASMKDFILTALVSGGVSILFLIALRNERQKVISSRDGFLLVVFCWFAVSIVSSFPYFMSGGGFSITDAFFESTSGLSTTGATVLYDIEKLPKSLLLWRSLTHWLGGMGIVVLGVAILPLLGIGGMQLMKAEAPGPTVDKITPRITETAKYLWYVYVFFTVAEIIMLRFGGMDLFDSINHSLSTVATGGFSTKNSSIKYYDSAYIDYVITFFMLMSGISFPLHVRVLTGNFKGIVKNTELKAYLFIFICATICITYSLHGSIYTSLKDSIRYASFQTASILTTTGFSTSDYVYWTFFGQVIILIMMFIGGCSGSTAGGIKVIRIATLLKQGLTEMKFLVHPRGVFLLRINGSPVGKSIVYAISGFFFLYICTVLLITVAIAGSGEDLLTSFTASLASVGNIGPAFGNVGPNNNYGFLSDYVKWVLSVAMMAGRLELYTIFVLFTPYFWKK